MAPEVQREPKDEQILIVIANVFKLVLGLLLKDLNTVLHKLCNNPVMWEVVKSQLIFSCVLSISQYIPGTSYVSSFLIIRKSCEVDNVVMAIL